MSCPVSSRRRWTVTSGRSNASSTLSILPSSATAGPVCRPPATPRRRTSRRTISLAVARAIPGYQDQGKPFMAFVYRIAANKIVDARRSQSRDPSLPTETVPDLEVSRDTPESIALEVNACNDVVELLDTLSDKARQIVTLRVFGGYSAEETAEIVGSTAGAVRVAQFRAPGEDAGDLGQSSPSTLMCRQCSQGSIEVRMTQGRK